MALMLGACQSQNTGAGASKDSIPLSKVIFSDEDVLIYYERSVKDLHKDRTFTIFLYKPDGTLERNNQFAKLGVLAQHSDEEIIANNIEFQNSHESEWCNGTQTTWNIVTDETGNNTKYIEFSDSGNLYKIYPFSRHITIYDSSYMVFDMSYNTGSQILHDYILIRDTKDTIDKTIYLDAPGTEGFTVDGQ